MVDEGKEEQGCEENLIGRTVKKLFTGYGHFTGKVISFSHRSGYYRVKYEDGDREQLELHELKEILTDANTDFPALKIPACRSRKRSLENHAAEVTGVAEAEKTGSKQWVVRSKKFKNSNNELDAHEIVTRRTLESDLIGTVDANVITQSNSKEIVDRIEDSTRSRRGHRCRHLGGANVTEEKGKQGAEQLLKHANRVSRKRVLEVTSSDGKSPVAQPSTRFREAKTPSTPVQQLSGSGDTEFGTNDDNSDRNYEESESSEIEEQGKLDTQAQVLEIPPLLPLPAPSTDLPVPIESVADLFEVFTFLRSFSWVLFLSPFLLKDFAACVVLKEANALIDAVHVSLLRVLQRHLERLATDGSEMATICLRHHDWNFMDSVTWPSYLVAFLLTHGFSKEYGKALLQLGFEKAEYYRVGATVKLAILSFLCQKALETDEIRAEIATRADLEAEMDLDESKVLIQKANKWANWRVLSDLNMKRSISFDTYPERANEKAKESRTRGYSTASCGPMSGNQRVQSSNGGGKRHDSIGAVHGKSKEAKDVTSPVRNLEQLQDGCDWNSDECVLCGMDGNLICCDGCPAAYHSRCVGVCKLSLPEGDWYCPECVVERQNENVKLRKSLRGAQFLGIDPHGRAYTATCGYLLVSETFSESAAIRNYYYAYSDLPSILEFLKSCGPLFREIQNGIHQLWRFFENSFNRAVFVQKNDTFNINQGLVNSNIPGREMQELPAFISSLSKEEPSVETTQIVTQMSDTKASPAAPNQITKSQLNCHLAITNIAVLYATANDSDTLTKACCTSSVEFIQKPEHYSIAPEISSMDVGKSDDRSMARVPIIRLEQFVDKLSAGYTFKSKAATETKSKTDISVEQVDMADNKAKVILNGAIDGVADFINTAEQVNIGVTADNEGICIAESGNFDSPFEKGVVSLEQCKEEHGPIKVGHYETFHVEREMSVPEIHTQDKIDDTRHEELEANRVFGSPLRFSHSSNILVDQGHALSPPSGSTLQKVSRVRARTQLQVDLLGDERSSKACLYVNRYVLGDAAASAAANFITASAGEKLGVELTLAQRKAWAALQVKAVSQVPGTFYWPNAKKKLMETPKERCGWCFACQSPNRKACFLNQVANKLSEGAALISGGIRPIKKGHDHLPSVASYMLYMEDCLHGLLIGPWEKAEQRRRWRKRVEQSASFHDIKTSLLEIGCSLRMIALKTDWSKSVEDAPELIPSSVVTASVAGVSLKKTLGGRRGRREVFTVEKQTSCVGGSAWGIHWWRGGRVARKFLDWETLPRSTSRRAARLGGLKEISGLIYSEGLECPRRTRICAWQARVESAHSISQIALQMRYLDAQIRWEDLLMKEGKTDADELGMGLISPIIKKSSIHAKMLQSGAYMYLMDSEGKHTGATKGVKLKSIKSPSKLNPIWTLTSGSDFKEATQKGDQVWLSEDSVPLCKLKRFEEQLRKFYPGKVSKSRCGRQGKKKNLKLSKREHFRMLLQKLVQSSDNNDLSSWKCAFCKKVLGASKPIQCQNCRGKFHKECIKSSNQTEAFTCSRCSLPWKSKRGRKPAQKSILPSGSTDLCSAKVSQTTMKGNVENMKSMSESLKEQGSMNSNFMGVVRVNRKKRSSSLYVHKDGVLWKKVKPVDDLLTFRRDKIVLVRQEGIDHSGGPICCLCSQPYTRDLMYIGCEFCEEWFHADGFGVTQEKLLLLAGFKCYKCRKKGPPQCPYFGRKNYGHSYPFSPISTHVKPSTGDGRHLLDRIGFDPCVISSMTNLVSEEADQFVVEPSMDFLVTEEDFSTGWAADTEVPLTSMDLIQPHRNVPVPGFDWATLQNGYFSPDADASQCNNMQVCHHLDVESNINDAVEHEEAQINLQAEGSENPLPQIPCRGPLSFLELLSSEDDMVENVPFPEMDLNLIWLSDTSISRHVSSAILEDPGKIQPGAFIPEDAESMETSNTSLKRGHVIVEGGLIHDLSLANGEIRL